jgi:hypothetical protein
MKVGGLDIAIWAGELLSYTSVFSDGTVDEMISNGYDNWLVVLENVKMVLPLAEVPVLLVSG